MVGPWLSHECSPSSISSGSTQATELNQNMEDSNNPPPLDVNDEYRRAIRTNSYTEIYDKLHQNHHKPKRTPPSSQPSTPIAKSENFASPNSASSNSSTNIADYTHLSDYLDPPDQDILLQPIIANRTLHSLLQEYFLTGVEVCHLCSSVLVSIHIVRRQHNTLSRLLANNSVELASYVDLENPFTNLKLPDFRHFHDRYASLMARLAVSRRKMNTRVKILKVFKHTSGAVVMVLLCGLSVAFLVVATHGMLAAFCPAAMLFGAIVKRKLHCTDYKHSTVQQLKQVDAAAKGAYILSRGLETLGRMVSRLDVEIEHGKDVARMLLRSGGERFLQKEVLREMDGNEEWFLEALDELEEHVFWCLNTINKTRRLLAHELIHDDGDGSVVSPPV